MSIDRESLNNRLEKLKECLEKLKPIRKVNKEEFLASPSLQDITERNLQVAIQACLDIGDHTIAALGFKRPEDYKDTFIILGKEGVLPNEFSSKIVPMAGLRNILIHEYLEIKPEKIYGYLQEISDFEKFAQHLLEFLKKEKLYE